MGELAKNSVTIISKSADETRQLASLFAACCRGGEVIGLSGPLGAGKTEFVRGIGEYFGIAKDIVSPSYVLECVYPVLEFDNSRIEASVSEIHHWDFFRLSGVSETTVAIEELLEDPSCLTFIEWSEKFPECCSLLSCQISINLPDDLSPLDVANKSTSEPGDESRIFVFQFFENIKFKNCLMKNLRDWRN